MFVHEERFDGESRMPFLREPRRRDLGYGRFMQPDPIGYGDGLNWYSYAGSNPINVRDPLGLSSNACINELLGGGVCVEGNRGGDNSTNLNYNLPFNHELGHDLNGGGDAVPQNDVIVIARRRGSNFKKASYLAEEYFGLHFCPNPTVGALNRFNPFGRIVSGKNGGIAAALRDIDLISSANGITPMRGLPVNHDQFELASNSFLPVPLSGGWYGSYNPFSGEFSTYNRGLTLRYSLSKYDIKVDIPTGFNLPTGGVSEQNETCHYYP